MADFLSAELTEGAEEDDGRRKQLDEARKNALYYGWEYFKYHAQQRQAVFRFYLILVSVALAGLVASYSNQYQDLANNRWVLGLSLVILSLMFWRLDVRSYQLVKIAEAYLFYEEAKLATDLDTDTIRLTFRADSDKKWIWKTVRLATFRQVYTWIFLAVGLGGVIVVLASLGLWSKVCSIVGRKIEFITPICF